MGYESAMEFHLASVPWNTTALWQEANASLGLSLLRNRSAMGVALNYASQLRHLLERTSPIMETLCRQTCRSCEDICCRQAWVWADFRDLLFLHLAEIPLPDGQLISRSKGHCRYAGPDGCRLDRIQRPFVCTWYLCPAQARLLDHQSFEKHNLSRILEQIKNDRKRMEAAYIRAII